MSDQTGPRAYISDEMARRFRVCLLKASHDRFTERKRLFFYGAIIVTVLSLVTIGFFLHTGVHGLYTDDYSKKAWAFDFTAFKWRPNLHPMYSGVRPLAYMIIANAANAIPEHEFPLRVAIVAVHLLNVILLAMLAYRLSRSILVSVLVGAFFLFPIMAYDALLWFTASIHNIFALFFLLVGYHVLLSCRSVSGDISLLICGVMLWSLALLFFEVGLLIQVLLPAFFWMMSSQKKALNHKVWITALAASYVPQGLYCLLWERNSPVVTVRGSLTFNPAFLLLHRVPEVFHRTVWLATGGGIHVSIFREALLLGLREWLSSSAGYVVLLIEVLGLALASLLYPARDEQIPNSRHSLELCLAGLAWAILGLAIILIFTDQTSESRILYIPYAGLSLSFAGVVAAIPGFFGEWRQAVVRPILLGIAAILLVNSLTMAGLVMAFQLRWDLDRRQLTAFRTAVTVLPNSNPLWVLPVTLDERTVTHVFGKNAFIDRWLPGVFEQSWSACDALRLMYGDRDIHCAASTRWGRLHLTAVQYSEDGKVSTLSIQGNAIPVDHLLAFTYQNGSVTILNPVELTSGAASVNRVNLPLATALAQVRGAETEPIRFEVERQN